MIKSALSLAVACALGVSGAAFANGYQYELSLGFDRADQSGSNGYKGDMWSLSGTYYLDRIDDSTGPLAEAAFINQASYLNAHYGYLSKDFDGDAYGIGGEYVTNEHGIIFGASYDWVDDVRLDYLPDSAAADIDSYRLTIGQYLTDSTTVRLSYQHDDVDGPGRAFDFDVDTVGLNVRHLTGDLGNGMHLALEADLQRIERDFRAESTYRNTLMGVGADLYFNRHVSVGGGYHYITGDDEFDGDGFEVRDRYHINPQFFVAAKYGHEEPDEFARTKVWGVEVATRF